MLLAKTVEGEEVVEEVSKLTQYINDKIPDVIDFALSVVLALVVYRIYGS